MATNTFDALKLIKEAIPVKVYYDDRKQKFTKQPALVGWLERYYHVTDSSSIHVVKLLLWHFEANYFG